MPQRKAIRTKSLEEFEVRELGVVVAHFAHHQLQQLDERQLWRGILLCGKARMCAIRKMLRKELEERGISGVILPQDAA